MEYEKEKTPNSLVSDTTPQLQNILENIEEQFQNVLNTLSQFKLHITTLQNDIRGVEKVAKKQIRVLNKQLQKKKNKAKRQPSGFAKPVLISDTLCNFLELPIGSKMARTDVTKQVIKYIKANDLQCKINKKQIIPDSKLQSLLEIGNDDELTYFSIQTYMNKHFI